VTSCGLIILSPSPLVEKQRQQVLPSSWFRSIQLHCVTLQKTVILTHGTVKTSNLTQKIPARVRILTLVVHRGTVLAHSVALTIQVAVILAGG
jgi:hypothetical protein